MIVKNESENLDRCLKSVYKYVDEIIIVDTGSTDNTVDIAKRYTSSIYNFEWVNDFSLARNYSLSLASSDWILVLDADECLAERDIKDIKEKLIYEPYDAFELIKYSYSNNPNIARFSANDHVYQESAGWVGWQNEPNDLLFRNDARIYYEDCIHETVRKSVLKNQLRLVKTTIPVHHYGRNDMSVKSSRYIEMVKERHKNNPNDYDTLFTLGSHLDWDGELEEALEVFKKCEKMVKDDVRVYYALGLVSMKLKQIHSAEEYYLKAINLDPMSYDIVFRDLMLIYFFENKYQKAFDVYNLGIKHNPNNILLQFGLANIYYQLGYTYVAKNELENLLSKHPEYEDAKTLRDLI
jgi:glycosyltransferase involved in cell wall biosynthesis